MAKVTGHCGVRASQRKAGCTVVEGRAQPASGRVARGAGCWIARRDVIWHRPAKRRGALPVGGVATITIRGQRAGVVAVDVAQRTGHRGVRASQRESRGAVIES